MLPIEPYLLFKRITFVIKFYFMKNLFVLIVVFGAIGLAFGYAIFGKFAGEYVSLKTIFGESANALESFGRQLTGLEEMKQKILISGGVGGIIGLFVYYLRKK